MTSNQSAVAALTRLDPDRIALLLDVDGTLIDLAPGPFDVHVPDELRTTLARLLERGGGALALVSGRPIRDLDLLFTPLQLPAIGGHGAEMRLQAGETVERVHDLPDALRRDLIAVIAPESSLDYEDKGYSVALHFRRAAQEEERLRDHIARVLANYPDEGLEVLPGKAIFEIKRPGVSKGAAVRALMQRAPFAGRIPVFIGDDVTDESVFAVMPELGGINFSVSREFSGVSHVFSAPAEVRRALAQIADSGR